MGVVPRRRFRTRSSDHWGFDPRVSVCTDRWVFSPVVPARCRLRSVCALSVPIASRSVHYDRSVVARVPERARFPGPSTSGGSGTRPPLVDAGTLRPLSSACCRPPLARVLTLIAFKLTSVAISCLGLSVSYARGSRLWCWDCALSQRERQLPSTATG